MRHYQFIIDIASLFFNTKTVTPSFADNETLIDHVKFKSFECCSFSSVATTEMKQNAHTQARTHAHRRTRTHTHNKKNCKIIHVLYSFCQSIHLFIYINEQQNLTVLVFMYHVISNIFKPKHSLNL